MMELKGYGAAMRRASFLGMNCSIARSLEQIGDWWTLLIVRDAQLGITRFDDFQRSLGISRNTLTNRLAALVEHGVLTRAAAPGSSRERYVLTEKGRDLWQVVTMIRQWGDRWVTPPGEEPVVLDHVDCRHEITAELTCSACREVLEPSALRARPGPGA